MPSVPLSGLRHDVILIRVRMFCSSGMMDISKSQRFLMDNVFAWSCMHNKFLLLSLYISMEVRLRSALQNAHRIWSGFGEERKMDNSWPCSPINAYHRQTHKHILTPDRSEGKYV